MYNYTFQYYLKEKHINILNPFKTKGNNLAKEK